MVQKMEKRIPVSESRWKQLGEMKGAGVTYDQLIKELIQKANRYELAKKLRKAERGEGKWLKLEENVE